MRGIFFGTIIEINLLYLHSQIIINMIKKYAYIILFFLFLISFESKAQENKGNATIEGFNFYPNPVSNGKVYISSKSMQNKEVAIYDVLGKKVLQSTMTSKELNVSSLSPGVYIIKIKEGEATATRKLIIK